MNYRNKLSAAKIVQSDVPQGIIFGPFLFSITYLNSIVDYNTDTIQNNFGTVNNNKDNKNMRYLPGTMTPSFGISFKFNVLLGDNLSLDISKSLQLYM